MPAKAFELIGRIALDGQKKVQEGLQGVSDNAEKSGGKLDKIKGTAKKVGKGLATFGAVGAGAVGAIFAGTMKVAEGFDKIAKDSHKLGVSTDAYQEMDYWAGQNGVSSETMERAVGRLNQRIGLAAEGNEKYSEALQNLGIDMEAVEDGTLKTEDAMAQSIQALSEMESESQKSAAASELFGTKMARDLMPALQDGSLSLDEAKEKAEELGIVIGEDTLEGAEEFNDTWDDLTRSFGAFGKEIFGALMPAFTSIMEWAMDALPKIRDWFDEVFDKESLISDFGEAFGNLKRVLKPVADFIMDFGRTIFDTVEELMPTFQDAFDSITEILGGFWEQAQPIFNDLREIFKNVFGFAGDIIKEIVPIITETFEQMQPIIEAIILFFQERVVPTIQGVITRIQEFWNEHGAQIMEAIRNFAQIVVGIIQWAFPFIQTIINGVWTTIQNIISSAMTIIEGIIKVFSGIFTGDFSLLWEGIKDIFGGAIDFVIGLVTDGIIGDILGMFATFGEKAMQPFTDVWDWATEKFNDLVDFIDGIITDIIGFFTGLGDKLGFDIPKPKLPSFTLKGELDLVPPGLSVPTLGVKWNAQGGFLNQAQLLGAGEVDEAILPLENRKNMQPFALAVAENLKELNGGNTRIEVPIQLNNREILRAIIPDLDRELSRKRKRQSGLVNRGNL